MNSPDIRSFLRSAVTGLASDPVQKTDTEFDSCHLMEDLELDSLDVINILFLLEEQYAVKIPEPDIDAEELYRVGNLIAYIEAQLA